MGRLLVVNYKDKDFPLRLANGDQYDSTIDVYDGWDITKGHNQYVNKIYTAPFANADASVKSKNIAVALGDYFWIKGLHNPSKQYTLKNGKKSMGYPAIIYFNLSYLQNDDNIIERFEEIKTYEDLTLEERTFPANAPNPNWNNKKILKFINLHRGGQSWDWSAGCHTIFDVDGFYSYWDEFIELFKMNEKGKLIIKS